MKIGILTSGGDAPGMNAVIRSVVRVCLYNNVEVAGINRGYQGLLEGDIHDMGSRDVSDIIQRGGTVLKTARCEEFKTKEGIEKGLEMLKLFKIDALVVCGGDGSFRGALELSKRGFPVMGVPGTIDNDLGYTEYTVGFDTAVNTVINSVSHLRDTSSSHGRANIIEVMGRSCGDIALYAGLASGADSIVVPEIDFDVDDIYRKMIEDKNNGKTHHIILLAEGVGKPYEMAEAIEKRTGLETRVSVIGYLQRGGSPTAFDRILASRLARAAVELLIKGDSGKAIGIKGTEIISTPLEEAITKKDELNKDMLALNEMLSI